MITEKITCDFCSSSLGIREKDICPECINKCFGMQTYRFDKYMTTILWTSLFWIVIPFLIYIMNHK